MSFEEKNYSASRKKSYYARRNEYMRQTSTEKVIGPFIALRMNENDEW